MSKSFNDLLESAKSHILKNTLPGLTPILISFLAVIVALFFVFVFISFSSGVPFPDLWLAFFNSSFGSVESFGRMLTKASLIMIVTIGLCITFRSNLFNIGAQGQMALGNIFAAGMGLFLPIPIFLRVVLAFIITFLVAGSITGAIGWLKAKFGIDEIFITLMFSFIFVALLNYLINGPWGETGSAEAKTPLVPGRFPEIFPGLTPIIFIAFALAVIAYFY